MQIGDDMIFIPSTLKPNGNSAKPRSFDSGQPCRNRYLCIVLICWVVLYVQIYELSHVRFYFIIGTSIHVPENWNDGTAVSPSSRLGKRQINWNICTSKFLFMAISSEDSGTRSLTSNGNTIVISEKHIQVFGIIIDCILAFSLHIGSLCI